MDSSIFNKFKFKLHSDAITCICVTSFNLPIFATGSRDCTILIWKIVREDEIKFIPKKRLRGHSHFISNLDFSMDGRFCLSSSWDKTINLWDIENTKIVKKFIGHQHDVLWAEFSKNNKKIISSSRDNTIKIWNTIGQCKSTLIDKISTSWISCVKFISNKNIGIMSCSWDGMIKIWNMSKKKVHTRFVGHKGYLCSLSISPDSSLCASGGKDGIVMLWDLQEAKHLYSLDINESINCLCFCPTRYWLCAGTSKGVKIWDLESKVMIEKVKADLPGYDMFKNKPMSMSINWTADGNFFFSGFIDGELKICYIRT
ncbi:guanine nucleotide-binding protein beta SU like protein (nucleomorph) [Cryptomonas paramecium]|uniref:Guanine nucleotide-binding protein beta SU like protein n=1 Tax=Cryptomonas paramaecium TaxID=2898 RepID=F2HI42_9CRYP|nr:guanine nucleotide-binding protein beta SU like protein [Cryptomonas paramecium]AEA39105.1 guanine nucleotide-binding protein beta SU like protein [Cryptomonas paramecium]|mmetsp:Transcript_67660/g.180888  ORF Transcript_67660/g.180888 Transcript_67660/m.180888 type:complete len:314 (+) Transcript_67660:1447-2388(+)